MGERLHCASSASMLPLGYPREHFLSELGNYVQVSAIALTYYEYLLAIPSETKLIWQQRFSAATVIYAANRYALLGFCSVQLASLLYTSPSSVPISILGSSPHDLSCSVLFRLRDLCTLTIDLALTGFTALRIYAIYGMNKRIFALILALGLGSPAVQIFNMVIYTPVSLGPHKMCVSVINSRNSLKITQTATSARYLLALAFEASAVVLTWYRTFSQWRLARSFNVSSLTTLFLRDGTLYFLALLILTLMTLIATLRLSIYTPLSIRYLNLASIFVFPLSSICLSKFILSLRSLNASNESGLWDQESTQQNAVQFRSRTTAFLGNLGAQLRTGDGDEDNHAPPCV